MSGAQSAAPWAIQSCRQFEKAAGIKTMLRRIKEIQSDCSRQSSGDSQPKKNHRPPLLDPNQRRHFMHDQWNAAFTSGLERTIKTQMPTGNPTQQQGERQ